MPASIKHLTDRRVIYNSLLARWKDGLYYTAVLTKCDRANKKCRVCFEDGSEIWVSNRDLHIQLTLDQLSEDEDIVCCICDDGNSEPPNEIILCDVCQQGYHQNCHLPPVDASKLDDSEETKDHKDWFCATCSFILNQTNRAKLSAKVAAAQQQQHQQQHDRTTRKNSSTPSSSSLGGPSSSKQPRQEVKPSAAASNQTPASSAQQSKPKQQTINATPSKPTTTPAIASATTTMIPEKTAASKQQAPVVKQPPKVKQTPSLHQQMGPQKSTVGAIKSDIGQHQRSAPYYPLSNQARAMATSSTAALASLTASSALVVGGSAGRTKHDLVKQSNRSTQRHTANEPTTAPAKAATAAPADSVVTSVPKHAVRKSSMNFSATPVKQSALPTATRSSPTASGNIISSNVTKNMPAQVMARATVTARPVITTMSVAPSVTTITSTSASAQSSNNSSSYSIMALTDQSKALVRTSVGTNEPAVVRVDCTPALISGGGVSVNNETKEKKSVISSGPSAAQQASGESVGQSSDTSSNSLAQASSGGATDKSNCSALEDRAGNISSSSASSQAVEAQPAGTEVVSAPDSTRTCSINDSGNGGSTANKPATVIVGANLD